MNAAKGIMEQLPEEVLQQYGLQVENTKIIPLTSGLINTTFKVITEGGTYVLQEINTDVFTNIQAIQDNVELLEQHLWATGSDYRLIAPISLNGTKILNYGEHVYRVFNYVPGSVTITTVANARQAYQAAFQFGNFTAQFSNLQPETLKETLPGFHDLSLRYSQFEAALAGADAGRKAEAGYLTELAFANNTILNTYKNIVAGQLLPLRVIHHDTKISNILFDGEDNGLCVIDLDTVMPGYIVSDLGDMMRTYLCALPEDTADTAAINVNTKFFEAIATGYTSAMGKVLTTNEWKYFVWSGSFIIYMQALRFLTDYLNGNVYYKIKYPLHNLQRAKAQFSLLAAYQSKTKIFVDLVARLAKKYGCNL